LNMIMHEGLRLRGRKSKVGDMYLCWFDSQTVVHIQAMSARMWMEWVLLKLLKLWQAWQLSFQGLH
jgi:hypothetical protein